MTLGYKWHFGASVLAAIISSILFLLIPRLLGEGVDKAFLAIQDETITRSDVQGDLITVALLVILVSTLRGTFGFFQMYLGETLAQRVASRMRLIYFEKLQALSFSFHDGVHTGQLMSRGLSDVEGVRMFVQSGMVQVFRVVIMLVAAAILMSFLDWQLALISLSFVPFLVLRSAMMRLRLRVIWKQIQDALGDLSTTMEENLSGIKVVRAFSAQRYEEAKFDVGAREVVDLRMKAAKIQASGGTAMSFAFLVAWAIVLWFGGEKVIQQELTVGELAQFFTYLAILQFPVRMIPMLVNAVARAAGAGGRLYEVLDINPAIADKPGSKPLNITGSVVKFEDVSFGYHGVPALEHISFEARPDHTIGIVGAPGSGKSSIAHLLPRFYDPDSGHITVDGVDLTDVTTRSVRSAVGLIQQDPFLFDGTIKDNIRYSEMEASDETVIEAAKIAQIHDFIDQLPLKYDSEIGERGTGLSGGQRQRVAIARTLLTGPPVLIFDDSTSSVDAGTDARIRQELGRVAKGRTTIIIAHRLSSLMHAQEILVLDTGRIVERGNHDDLIALGGRYSELWSLQQKQATEIDE
jgi:ATP-binding cassette subfamily B protein